MTADAIVLTGIRALGAHGVLPEEQARPQPFEVDLELRLDLTAAGRSDTLSDTIDYDALTAQVVGIVEKGGCQLLEALATRIAEAAKTDPRVQSVMVTVRKLRPPVPVAVDHVAVRIER
ncbi:MAG: dihydroneopterin aldolase [Acidimicrobiia bacterium]